MKTLSSSKFKTLFENGIIEPFSGSEYTFTNYDEEFYFYYDAEKQEFEDQGEYKLTEDQLNTIANAIDKKYQEDLTEERESENAPFAIDHYEEYGVSRSMFI